MSFLPILFGLALGDSLGWPVEFKKLADIRAQYGPNGVTEPPAPALFTDDTQMTLAVAEALVLSGHAEIETLMQTVAEKFIDWAHHPDTPGRAPGHTCLRGVANLENGMHWQAAGIKESKGCGSAMRAAPIGYLYQHNPNRLREVAHAVGFATHQHPAADAAALAAAYLIKLALDGEPPGQYPRRLIEFCRGRSIEFDAAIQRVTQVLDWPDTDAAIKRIGEGWVGEEAVALALYCCLKHPDDYLAAVRLGANIDGDSDSVACIAGGVMGARLSLSAIPMKWIARLERRSELETLAEGLTVKRAQIINY